MMTLLNMFILLEGLEPTAGPITADWIVTAALILMVFVTGFFLKKFTSDITAKIDNVVKILNEIQKTLAAQAEKNDHFKGEIEDLCNRCIEMDSRQSRLDRKIIELTRTIDLCPNCPSPRKEH